MSVAAAAKRRAGMPPVVTGSLAQDYERVPQLQRTRAEGYALPRERTYVDAIPEPRERARVRTRQYVSPVLVLGGAGVLVLAVFLILSYVQLAVISSSVVDKQEQLSELLTDQVVLKTKYEQAFDMASVKEAAEAAGMSLPSESQIYYLDLSDPDNAVVYSEGQSGIMGLLSEVQRSLMSLVEYFR